MITQTIKFANEVTLPVIAVYSKKELIQNAYRECFEIRFPTENTTLETIGSLATPANLSKLTLIEKDNESDDVISQYSYFNYTIVTGMGIMSSHDDGSKFFFLNVAQKSDMELQMEQLMQDNEDIQSALVELAGIISEE